MPIKGILGGAGVKPLGYGLGGAETEATDAEFNQTVLLLHGDGSEGEGNTSALGDPNYKAFKDNSTSAHAIIINGDAYGNDFSPYYYADGYWSSYHESNSGYYFPHSSDYNLGSGEFTVEFWMNANDLVANQYICGQVGSGGQGSDTAIQIYISNADGRLTLYLSHGGAAIETPAASISANTWHFVSCVRQSNTLRIYVDGVQKQSGSYSGTVLDSAGGFGIGQTGEYVGGGFKGFLSNLRLVVGSCLRDDGTTFSVPTTPLTSTGAETKILTAQSNRFIDNSPTGRTATLSNTPKISTNTPFTVTKTANVGSGFFDGDGDAVYATETGSEFTYGTGDFEFSCWVYRTVGSEQQTLFGRNSTGDANVPYIYITSGNKLAIYFTSSLNYAVSSTDVPKNAWSHLVVSRVSSTIKFFQDGVEVGSVGNTTDLIASGKVAIGNQWSGGNTNAFTGYIADARVRKGYGVTSVTVPTTTITAETGTELLTCQYSGAVRNVGFVDDSKYNHRITRNGDVNLGTFSPFSLEDTYWSNYLNQDNAIEIADSGNGLDLSGDFTVEFWVYEPKIATTNGTVNMYFSIDTLDRFQFSNNGSNNVLSINGGSVFSSTTAPLNQWNHIAIVRSGSGSNNISYYLNGSREAQGTSTYSIVAASMMLGGQDRGGTTGYHGFSGYFSNFRILKGTALYSGASITVPTEPLTAITNTSLLTCQSNRFVDNSTNNMALTTANTEVLPFSPFAPSRSYTKDVVGGSAYFDGTGDSLKIEPQNDKDVFNPYSLSYTLEMWLYVDVDTPGTRYILGKGGTAAGWSGTTGHYLILFYYNGSVYLQYKTGVGSFAQLNVAHGSSYQWNHFVIGYDGTTVAAWWNGARFGTSTTAPIADTATNGDSIYLGVSNDGSTSHWTGYISNVRYVRGTDIYGVGNASITIPTSPPTAVTNTNFLTTFTNAGIIDHTMKNNLETEGNTRISGQQIKFGTGSIYFDGTTDVIKMPNDGQFTFGTGDFTIEMFVYAVKTTEQALYDGRSANGAYPFLLIQNTSNKFIYYVSTGVRITANDTVPLDQWVHLAIARSGTTTKMFVNGTAQTGTFSDSTNYLEAPVHIGQNQPSSGDNFEGYLDEYRVTKGVARYTSNFTAPTKAFANK